MTAHCAAPRIQGVGNYARIPDRLRQAVDRLRLPHRVGQAKRLKNAILLLPANTQLAVFHDKLVGNAEILLLRSRLQFLDETGQRLGRIPFGHYIAMLGGTDEVLDRLMAGFPSVHLSKDARRSSG